MTQQGRREKTNLVYIIRPLDLSDLSREERRGASIPQKKSDTATFQSCVGLHIKGKEDGFT